MWRDHRERAYKAEQLGGVDASGPTRAELKRAPGTSGTGQDARGRGQGAGPRGRGQGAGARSQGGGRGQGAGAKGLVFSALSKR
jgi:hypothetical protein